MIGEPRRTGLWGEIYAARYLRDNGYSILAANFRSKSGEIDIVAKTGDTICFVEVKTRKEGSFFDPAYAVDKAKEENVRSTAAAFLAAEKIKSDFRFDIIEVVMSETQYKIRHTENAF